MPVLHVLRLINKDEFSYLARLTALYATISVVWLVLPVATRFGSVLLGTSIFAWDSVLLAGILEWGYHAIPSPHEQLFNWTAGFPLSNTLAVTENLIGWQPLYMPLRALGMSIAGAYNVLLLVSLVISAIGGAMLARRFGASRAGAAAAGLVFGFGPFHLSHTLHLQTMGVCWTPFAILTLDRYLETRSPRAAIALAVFTILSALCSVYFAVFLGVVLPLYLVLCWIFRRYRFDVRALLGLAATGAFVGTVLAPLFAHYVRFNRTFGYHHSANTLANFSMEAIAPLRIPDWLLMWSWSPLVRVTSWTSSLSYTPAFPGVIALALAVYAVARFGRTPETRRTLWMLLTIVVVSYLLALGPFLKPLNLNVPQSARWLPMPGKIWLVIPGIRWPMRIFFFAWLAGSVLVGLGVSTLQERIKENRRTAIGLAAIFLITIELWPKPSFAGDSMRLLPPMQMGEAYPFLSGEADGGGVVELPVAGPDGWRTPFSTEYIYASSGHLRRVVALHGSITPPITDSLLRAAVSLPDSQAADFLASRGVTRVVLHLPLMQDSSSASVRDGLTRIGYRVLFTGKESLVLSLVR